ncbi:DUF4177 domain-containing protein [Bacillus subtilis subsp. subtilis]|nr:DUF4177 domain-containing protein [Bacillus subtilis subsp. subtilis]
MSKRWSYLTVEVKPNWTGSIDTEEVQTVLNRHGQLGWELINIVFAAPMTPAVLLFKKEL